MNKPRGKEKYRSMEIMKIFVICGQLLENMEIYDQIMDKEECTKMTPVNEQSINMTRH